MREGFAAEREGAEAIHSAAVVSCVRIDVIFRLYYYRLLYLQKSLPLERRVIWGKKHSKRTCKLLRYMYKDETNRYIDNGSPGVFTSMKTVMYRR